MTKRVYGASPRCGKSIRYHICPDCHTPLKQINETTFCCPVCKHKLKALAYSTPNEAIEVKNAIEVQAPVITGTLQSQKNEDRAKELQKWFIKRVNERIHGYGRREY